MTPHFPGITAPFITEPDPDTLREGSLDPLGLAVIADRLADELAPEITARMSRIRFVTAIAACSALLGEPDAWLGEDGSPAYLPFEWLVVEAMVRSEPKSNLDGVPGIRKARARLRHTRRHLDAGSYLKTPKVFGFTGVYKRLAKDLEVVDNDLILLPRGEELLRAWEREQNLEGFVGRRPGTRGGKLADVLYRQVQFALEHGHVNLGPTSMRWGMLASSLAPSDAGRDEARMLWGWLSTPDRPVRTAYVEAISQLDPIEDERTALEVIAASTENEELSARLEAVAAYEALARPLSNAFAFLRVCATERRPAALPTTALIKSDVVGAAARAAVKAFREAVARLADFGLATQLEQELGAFGDTNEAPDFVHAMIARHEDVQSRKNARPWFDQDDRGLLLRGVGVSAGPFESAEGYLHPYRAWALSRFASDLGIREPT